MPNARCGVAEPFTTRHPSGEHAFGLPRAAELDQEFRLPPAALHPCEVFAISSSPIVTASDGDPDMPATAQWAAFGVPTPLTGGIGWLASVSAERGTFEAIFAGPADAPRLLLRTTLRSRFAKPPSTSSTMFIQLGEPEFSRNGNFAVLARTKLPTGVEQTGIWLSDELGLRQMLLVNGPAPGVPAARVTHIESCVLSSDGALFAAGQLRQETASAPIRALWVWTSSSGWRLLLCEGAGIPFAQTRVIDSLTVLRAALDSPDERRYDRERGIVPVSVRWKDGRVAVLTINAEGATTLHWQSEIGRSLTSCNLPLPEVLAGRSGIVAKVMLPIMGGTTAPVERIIVAAGEQSEIVAESGRTAVGTNGRLFRSFSEPVSHSSIENGAIAFLATLQQTHGANSRTLERGIWWKRTNDGSTLQLLARTGDPAPGCEGMRFADFRSIAVLPGGGPIFSAKIGRTGVPRDDNEVGLWAVDRTDRLILVLRQGDSVADPTSGTARVVKGFDVFRVDRPRPIEGGDHHDVEQGTQIAIRCYFADGTSGIVRATVP